MVNKMFIDDIRDPPAGFQVCRSSKEAIEYVARHGVPQYISFDHDLGGEDTSIVFINWLIESFLDGKLSWPKDFKFSIHSANPVGVTNIKTKMFNLIKLINGENNSGL